MIASDSHVQTPTRWTASAGNVTDAEYHGFLKRVNQRFTANTTGRPVFTTSAADQLWLQYLASFDDSGERQHHNCNACRQFIERFGHLAVIAPDGRLVSALWNVDDAPAHYAEAVESMKAAVEAAEVTGVFISSEKVFGTPLTGQWQHLSAANPAPHRDRLKTAFQLSAERAEDFKNVRHAMVDYPKDVCDQAVRLLESDLLARPEKLMGPTKWLAQLHADWIAAGTRKPRDNVAWLAVASAPAGFAHIRGGVAGTLLDDVKAGLPFADIARKLGAKMRADVYQRPQAAPAAGNIAAAEAAFAKLGLARAMERRYARLDDIQAAFWRKPAPPAPGNPGGLFGHLKAKDAFTPSGMTLPAQTMTWDKFQRTVLPEARKIEFYVPRHGNFAGLVTATHDDAPPILQWDSEEARNPVSNYVYVNGSEASRWNLASHSWVEVNAICDNPAHWTGERANQVHKAMLVLEGARDTSGTSLCLFPETLRSELHPFRSTVEAFSRAGRLTGAMEASACGFALVAGSSSAGWNARLRVTMTSGDIREVALDRWD